MQPNHYYEDLTAYLKEQKTFALSQDYVNRDFLEDNATIYLKIEKTDVIWTDYNYMQLKSSDKIRYYFINDFKYLNDGTWQITGTMDVINSFQKDVTNVSQFKQVKMKRMHKDRFNSMGIRKFDTVDEGFEPDIESTTSSAVGDNNRSYILYKQDTTTDSGYVKSLNSQLRKLWYPETSQAVTIDQYKEEHTLTFEVDSSIHYLIVDGSTKVSLINYYPRFLYLSPSGLSVKINKPNYNQFSIFCDAILIYPTDSGSSGAKLVTKYFKYDNGYLTYISGDTYNTAASFYLQVYGLEEWSSYIDLLNAHSYPSLTAGRNYLIDELVQVVSLSTVKASQVTPTATPLSMINKSNSELKQITEIPFIPGPASLCYLGGDNNEIGIKANIDLLFKSGQEVTINEWQPVTIPTDKLILREKKYETKLYGSCCRNYYLNYDNNTLVLQPERWQNTTPKVTSYAPCDYSNNLGFQVFGFTNKSEYDNWLLCSRNNNIQVSNDDYLEYIRTGYNYDVKNKQQQSVKNWVGFGLGVASTAATAGLGIGMKAASSTLTNLFVGQQVVNTGTSAISALSSNIMAEVQNQQALDQRKVQAMNSTVNISGNDNLALFHKYNQSIGLRLNKTTPHSYVEDTMFDLFYYYGYADNRTYNVMPTLKTRCYFNYVQAEIGYIYKTQATDTPQKVLEAIKAAYADGITFEWHYNNTWLSKGTLHENFETSLSQ